jgi:hypothetical protein
LKDRALELLCIRGQNSHRQRPDCRWRAWDQLRMTWKPIVFRTFGL